MQTCIIEKTKKARVRGDSFTRKELHTFKKLGTISNDERNFLLNVANTYHQNDLGSDLYDISKYCNYSEVFNANENYRQILLQQKIVSNENDLMNEYNYNHFILPNFLDNLPTIKDMFSNIYRFRISVMKGNHELNWHIDTDPSVICRAQICLKNFSSSFEFETKNFKESLTMDENDIYFINTGWRHRVINNSNEERIVAIFGFHFKDFKNNEILKLN
jgi:hypothetical protein